MDGTLDDEQDVWMAKIAAAVRSLRAETLTRAEQERPRHEGSRGPGRETPKRKDE